MDFVGFLSFLVTYFSTATVLIFLPLPYYISTPTLLTFLPLPYLLFYPYRTYFSTPTVLTFLPLPYLLFYPYLTYVSTPTLLTFRPLPYLPFCPYLTYFSAPTVLTLLPLPYLLFYPYLTFLPLPYLLYYPYLTYFSTPTLLTFLLLPYLLYYPYLTYFSTPTLLTFPPLPYLLFDPYLTYVSTRTHPSSKNIVNRSLVEFTFSPVSRDALLSHSKDLQRTLSCPVGQRPVPRDCPRPSCEGRDGPTASYKGDNYPIKERITLGNGCAAVRRACGMCGKSKQLGPRGGGRDRKDNEGQRCSFPGARILTRQHGVPEKKSESSLGAA